MREREFAAVSSRRSEKPAVWKRGCWLVAASVCCVQVRAWSPPLRREHGQSRRTLRFLSEMNSDASDSDPDETSMPQQASDIKESKSLYDLGAGKNAPFGVDVSASVGEDIDPSALGSLMGNDSKGRSIPKPQQDPDQTSNGQRGSTVNSEEGPRRVRRMVARNQESSILRGAIWHEEHYSDEAQVGPSHDPVSTEDSNEPFPRPAFMYPNIDLSIPPSIYDPVNGTDVVWDLLRWEAYQEAQREPLLVSFLYSSILNHDSLESSLAFILANKLSGTMIATQINSLIKQALNEDLSVGRAVRADIMAVRDRDPACTCLPDVFLYFKGFHALQTYRVAHSIWKSDKQVLAHYLQSQMSQTFQIDIHPNATLGSGIMLGESNVFACACVANSFSCLTAFVSLRSRHWNRYWRDI